MPGLEVIVNCPSLMMLFVLGGSSDLWVIGIRSEIMPSKNTLLHWWLNPGYCRVEGEAWLPSSTSLGSIIDLSSMEDLRER